MKTKRDLLDYVQLFTSTAATIAVPVLLAYFGNQFIASQNERTNAITESQNKHANALKYVELAVGILRADPKEQDAGLRLWAIEVLASQSVVPLTEKNKKALSEKQIRTDDWGGKDEYWSNSCSRSKSCEK